MKSTNFLLKQIVSLSVMICLPTMSGVVVFATGQTQAKDANSEAWSDCQLVCQPSKYDQFFSGPEGQERLEKVKQISGILEELEVHRQNFLRTGNFIELFPSVYYQITKIELDAIISDQMAQPIQKMDMMMRFYDAYENNRRAFERGGSAATESHWQEYYKQAQTANRSLTETGALAQAKILYSINTVLEQAIRAHVKFDLPRAISTITDANENILPQLHDDFQKSDAFFSRANDAANSDIVKALFPGSKAASVGMNVVGGALGVANDVINKRHKAWDNATDGSPLPTRTPQPIYDHNSNSTRYLPEELRQRGLCVHLSYEPSFTVFTRYNTQTKACRTDSITMKASGRISFGPWAGEAGPDGFPYPSFTAFNYDDMKQYNHGSLVIFLLQGNTSQAVGQGSSWTRRISSDGYLFLVVNDKEPGNNDDGGFEVKFYMDGWRLFSLN